MGKLPATCYYLLGSGGRLTLPACVWMVRAPCCPPAQGRAASQCCRPPSVLHATSSTMPCSPPSPHARPPSPIGDAANAGLLPHHATDHPPLPLHPPPLLGAGGDRGHRQRGQRRPAGHPHHGGPRPSPPGQDDWVPGAVKEMKERNLRLREQCRHCKHAGGKGGARALHSCSTPLQAPNHCPYLPQP